jgi:hypothetical protein
MADIPQGEGILAYLDRKIAAQETAARNADQGHWSVSNSGYEEWDAGVGSSSNDGGAIANCCIEEARHIALHDPASVLRRCTADRKLLELHAGRAHTCAATDYDGDYDNQARFYDHEACPVVRTLAEGYGWTEGER